MKVSATIAVSLLAALSVTASAQESSKSPGGGIEIGEVIERYAKRNGKQFALDSRVRAQVSLAGLDPAQINYDQLLSLLAVHGFVVSEAGGILAVVPDANARQLPSPIYTDVNFKASDQEIVSLVVTTHKVCAAHLVPVIRPLMPQAAHLAAHPASNTLIINDRAINARRVAALIEQIDRRGTGAKDCQPRETAAPPAPKPAA